VRKGAYDPLKVDVWSLGATVWEMAEAQPPFASVQDPRLIGERWPPLTRPEIYSRSFHDFLRLCSQSSASRPNPHDLLDVSILFSVFGFFFFCQCPYPCVLC
jgi:p21-activated kinase 1